jgi:flagellar protein FliO/FliZ
VARRHRGPNVTRNGGVGPRHRGLSTSPSRTALAASYPGVDHRKFPSFSSAVKTGQWAQSGSLGVELLRSQKGLSETLAYHLCDGYSLRSRRQASRGYVRQQRIDSRRRLVLIRRDNVEHLLIIGGPSDVVVEQNILRAATAPPEKGPARPPAMPRAPVGEDSMWPLQPEPAPPGAPAPRKARTADPLAELANELSRVPGVGQPAAQRRTPRLQPAPPAGSTAEAGLKPATNQNLSEMAQQLEATLRRPAKSSGDARTAARKQAAPEPFRAAPPSAGLDTMLRPPFRANEPRAPSGAPKALTEPAAPRGDDKAPSEPATPPREPDTQGRGDDGSVTNDRPWRLADLSFVPSGNGREKATINGVEVVKENGRYWIITPNGPLWSNIDERGVDPALNYLFEKRRHERQSGQ